MFQTIVDVAKKKFDKKNNGRLPGADMVLSSHHGDHHGHHFGLGSILWCNWVPTGFAQLRTDPRRKRMTRRRVVLTKKIMFGFLALTWCYHRTMVIITATILAWAQFCGAIGCQQVSRSGEQIRAGKGGRDEESFFTTIVRRKKVRGSQQCGAIGSKMDLFCSKCGQRLNTCRSIRSACAVVDSAGRTTLRDSRHTVTAAYPTLPRVCPSW